MTHQKLVINGITYVPETTEPVKPIRRMYWIDKGCLDAMGEISFYKAYLRPFASASNMNQQQVADVFQGEIIISKDDFDKAVAAVSVLNYSPLMAFIDALEKELFK